jgi:hypothetical protein
MKENNKNLEQLAKLKEDLSILMDPNVLRKLASLLEAFGDKNKTFIDQYKFWVNKNGENCRYAALAKEFFLRNNSKNVAKAIICLYDNWAKYYK